MQLSAVMKRLMNYPRYGPVGLHDPQQEVEVWLRGHGEPMDVTRNNAVAALRPFTIGVMFAGNRSPEPNGNPMHLHMYKKSGSKRLLGVIHLRLAGSFALPEHRLCLFETSGYENYSAPALSLRLYYLRAKRRAALTQRKNPHNFQMTELDLHCSYVFYICPRPVVLVSVAHDSARNMFPMDLIGPTNSPWYTMALRNTSPAVRLMQQSGRMALASIPAACQDVVYQLGRHHSQPSIDWAALPFPTAPSPLFGLPVSQTALRVREVRVREFHEVGSHTLFITSVEQETISAHVEPQLFHVFGAVRP